MEVMEASITYRPTGINVGADKCDSPEKVVSYMEGAWEDPSVEWIHVIILNRKNIPLGRKAVTKGTASATVSHVIIGDKDCDPHGPSWACRPSR